MLLPNASPWRGEWRRVNAVHCDDVGGWSVKKLNHEKGEGKHAMRPFQRMLAIPKATTQADDTKNEQSDTLVNPWTPVLVCGGWATAWVFAAQEKLKRRRRRRGKRTGHLHACWPTHSDGRPMCYVTA